MKCQDVENLLIHSGQQAPDLHEWALVMEHLQGCVCCARLKDDLDSIRNGLGHMPSEPLPEKLDSETWKLCRQRIQADRAHRTERQTSLPPVIWVLLGTLLILTVLMTVPLFKHLQSERPITLQTIVILVIILQNAVMLFFAPVLVKRYSGRQRPLHGITDGWKMS